MTDERRKQIEDIFQGALDLAQSSRAGFLEAKCGDDRELRHEVETLLEHYEAAQEGWFDSADPFPIPVMAQLGAESQSSGQAAQFPDPGPLSERRCSIPERVARYRIVSKIYEGYAACVFEAEQDQPRRRVALKLFCSALGTRSLKRRFEYEAEAAGQLRHPNIAQIIEAGTAPACCGEQPYFAMEFIEGHPLTRYADAHKLSVPARLELMLRVIDAVQHAHQKGVIHRDLKPDNILVDAGGQPKVLDFGVARATDVDVNLTTFQTDVGRIVGTFPYMSPEQISGEVARLDTRADVYALGVILYELLTGRLPLDMRDRTLTEAIRIIREQVPLRPSVVRKALSGDLDTIVRKAMEKDPGQRYPSAAALSEDIRRYLSHQPIVARPPSTVYQLRKMVVRHKVPSALLASLLLVLSSAGVGMSILYGRANAEARTAQRASDFLEQTLLSIDPYRAGHEVPLSRILDRAASRIPIELGKQPIIASRVRHTIGVAYQKLGLFNQAEEQLRIAAALRERHLGSRHLDTARTQLALGQVLGLMDRFPEAERLLHQTLETYEEQFGLLHSEVATARNSLGDLMFLQHRYDEAEQEFREALKIRRGVLSDRSAAVAESLNNVGVALAVAGKLVEAEVVLREARAISLLLPREESTLSALIASDLASVLHRLGQYAEARQCFRDALRLQRDILGDRHPNTPPTLQKLGTLLVECGDYDAAEQRFFEWLDLSRRWGRDDAAANAAVMGHLAFLYYVRDDIERAESSFRDALEQYSRTELQESPWLPVPTLYHLAELRLHREEQSSEAEATSEHRTVLRSSIPSSRVTVAILQSALADCLTRMGAFEEAHSLLLEAQASLGGHSDVPPAQRRLLANRFSRLSEASDSPERSAEDQAGRAGFVQTSVPKPSD